MKNLPKIPKEVHNFTKENQDLIEGTLEIDELDFGSVCKDLHTDEDIIYEGTYIFGDEDKNIFEWAIEDGVLKIWLGNSLVETKNTNYNLSYKDISYEDD